MTGSLIMTEVEIEEEVKRKYPKDPEERHCAQKRQRLNELRELLRKRLNEQAIERQILEPSQAKDGDV